MNKIRTQLPLLLLALLICCGYFIAWLEYVDPFPDRDSINQFYFPFLNFLTASQTFDPSFFFLQSQTFSSSYPWGAALFPWVISLFGAEGIFLENPFWLFIVLIPPVLIIPFFFRLGNLERFFLSIFIFFIPMTQLCLKGFSLHGFNVIFTLVGVLFLRSYMGTRIKMLLLGFIFFCWLGFIPKHLGAFYFFNIVFTYGVYSIISRKTDKLIWGSFFLTCLISVPFYPYEKLNDYLTNVITHNPYISVSSFFSIGTLLLLLGGITMIILSANPLKKALPKLKQLPLFFSLTFLITLIMVMGSHEAEFGNVEVIIYFLLGYGVMGYIIRNYEMGSTKGFLVLLISLTFINSMLLYCSRIGQTYHIFFLPILLIAIFEYVKMNRPKIRAYMLLACFLFSNFFPPILTLGSFMGEPGENIFINGFNYIYVNPFGWQHCDIPALRSEMVKVLSRIDFEEESILWVVEGVHFYTKLALSFPNNLVFPFRNMYRIDNLPPEELEKLYNTYSEVGVGIFENWLKDGKVPIIMDGVKPYTNILGDPPGLDQAVTKEEEGFNDFGRSLSFFYLKWLKVNNHLETHYHKTTIPSVEPRFNLYTLRSLKFMKPLDKWQGLLGEMAVNFHLEQPMDELPPWHSKLNQNNQIRLNRIMAGHLYLKADQLRENNQLVEAYILLRKALTLDPNHVGALEDSLNVQRQLSQKHWQQINGRLKPLDLNQLEKDYTESKKAEDQKVLEPKSRPLTNQERAHQLFILSNQFFEDDPIRAKELLKRALDLEPNHEDAKKDLRIIEKRMATAEDTEN